MGEARFRILNAYLVAIGTRTAIGIVSEPRPEHVDAITWLNESSSSDLCLLEIESIKSGDFVCRMGYS